jgi:hypothetical protein
MGDMPLGSTMTAPTKTNDMMSGKKIDKPATDRNS